MGFSTPKTPFNLAEFLSEKASPRSSRKPTWTRGTARSATAAEAETSQETPEAPEEGGNAQAGDKTAE